jgi:hypothetical protein
MRKSLDKILPKKHLTFKIPIYQTFGEDKVSLKIFDDSQMLTSSRAATILTKTPKTEIKGGFFDETDQYLTENRADSDRTEKLSFEKLRDPVEDKEYTKMMALNLF